MRFVPRRSMLRQSSSLVLTLALVACGSAGGSAAPSSLPSPSAPASPAATAFPANSYMAKIVQRGKLVAGVKQDVLLFGYLNPRTNQIEGFDVDVVKEIVKALFNGDASAARLELKPVTSAQRIPSLQEGSVDLVAATMTITDERKQQIDFSDVYYAAGQRVLVKKDSAATGIKDLDKPDKTICAAKGSTSEQNITTYAPSAQKLLFDGYAECLTALQQGRTDAVSTDDVILSGLAEQDPNTKLVGDKFTDEPYGLGIAKTSTGFKEFVDGVLRQIKQNGRWKAIYQQWLGKYGPVPDPPK
jgi:polar amino acid transport system substrate-binding protein